MQFKRLEGENGVKFSPKIRLTQAGDIFEILRMTKWSNGSHIKKLSSTEYVHLATGEVKEFKRTENRSESKRALKRTFEQIRQTINANVTKANRQNCRMLTFTYEGANMKDERKLYNDMKIVRIKARRKFGHFEYISVVEPHAEGGWHVHEIWIFPKKAPFIHFDFLTQMWGHGDTKITQIHDCDNLGAYLTAYLGDISLEEYNKNPDVDILQPQIKEVEIDGKAKKYVKGGRLHLYPTGMNIIRTSKGINRPKKEYTTMSKAEKKIGVGAPTYSRTCQITDETTGLDIVISKSYYNTARKNGQ